MASLLWLGVFGLAALTPTAVARASQKPHVLFILADDYGWGNIGYHRRDRPNETAENQAKLEVYTPIMDSLIDNGILLDRHYTYKICSPTRSSIQTGRLAVHVNPINAGVTCVNYNDPVSGFAGIPRNMTGLAAKMREGGYRAHLVGKWDAGMATPDHTPRGRGYETWMGYFQHANDYWRKGSGFLSTGEIDSCLDRMIDFSMHNETYNGGVRDAASLSPACQHDVEADPACYEEYLFKQRVLQVIRDHDTTKVENPLFLFYSFHLLHTPLQVPVWWLEQMDSIVAKAGGKPFSSSNRRLYAAMTFYMDSAIGEAVAALKEKGMYEDTLIIFTSDNGGPIYEPGAASNWPLKGSKYSDWEGGIRTNAFVSGGFVPVEKRGTKFEGIINAADWYGTLLDLIGVDMFDYKANKTNEWLESKGLPLLPPVDSVPQWGFIMNNTNGRTAPMHLSEKAVMMWPYKLVTGSQVYSTWTGPLYPNCSTVHSVGNYEGPLPSNQDIKIFGSPMRIAFSQEEVDKVTWTKDCGEGCLLNIRDDPTEHNDLAGDPKYAETLKEMQAMLKEMNKKLFNPDRGTGRVEGCQVAIAQGHVMGPFVDVDEGYYGPPPPRTRGQELKDDLLGATLNLLNNKLRNTVVTVANNLCPIILPRQTWDECISPEGPADGAAVARATGSQEEAAPEREVAFV